MTKRCRITSLASDISVFLVSVTNYALSETIRRIRRRQMEPTLHNYLPAIELLMCHLGKSFDEACDEVGLTAEEKKQLMQELEWGAREQ